MPLVGLPDPSFSRASTLGSPPSGREDGVTVAIDLRLQADEHAAAEARKALRSGLRDELDPVVVERAELLLSELVTNSVRHAGLSPGDSVEVAVRAERGYLWAQVSDRGHGFDPVARRPEPGVDHGWGLYLIDRVARRWGYGSDGGTTVWFELGNPTRSVSLDGDGVRTRS